MYVLSSNCNELKVVKARPRSKGPFIESGQEKEFLSESLHLIIVNLSSKWTRRNPIPDNCYPSAEDYQK